MTCLLQPCFELLEARLHFTFTYFHPTPKSSEDSFPVPGEMPTAPLVCGLHGTRLQIYPGGWDGCSAYKVPQEEVDGVRIFVTEPVTSPNCLTDNSV